MTLNYQKVWNTLNELESVTSKICSAREILDSALDALENNKKDKAETLMYAVDEYLQYYLEEFDRKFKDAWNETVIKVKEQEYCTDTEQKVWDGVDLNFNNDDVITFNISDTINSFWEENYYPDEYKGSTVCSVPPWGHSDMEALSYQKEKDKELFGCDEYKPEPFYSYYPLQSEDLIIGNEPRDYYTNVAPSATQRDIDKVVKWQLPVEMDPSGEYFIAFPDDLLERAGLKEGDNVNWVDNKNGTYTIVKVTEPLGMDEC